MPSSASEKPWPQPIRNLVTSLPLVAGDAASILLATVLIAAFGQLLGFPTHFRSPTLAVAAWGLLSLNYLHMGLYPACGISPVIEFKQVLCGSATVFAGVIVGTVAAQPAIPELFMGGFWACSAMVLLPGIRSLVRQVFQFCDWWKQPILVVGDPEQDRAFLKAIEKDARAGLRIAGPVIDSKTFQIETIRQQLDHHGANRLLFARDGEKYLEEVFRLGHAATYVHVLPSWPELSIWCNGGERAGCHELQFTDRLLLPSYRGVKRMMDTLIILAATPLLFPVFLVLGAAVKLSSPGPIFYRQQRIGLNGRSFWAWKFRTMVENADQVLQNYLDSNPGLRAEWERDHKLRNDPRVTSIGTFLRKSSLDELPQLWNVLIGDMSLVGPRPIVEAEVTKYGSAYNFYKKVLPGITGMWQISGRNNTTYSARVGFDCYYVRNWSPWLDTYILVRTIKTVLLREGAY